MTLKVLYSRIKPLVYECRRTKFNREYKDIYADITDLAYDTTKALLENQNRSFKQVFRKIDLIRKKLKRNKIYQGFCYKVWIKVDNLWHELADH